jgi:hypothetical protein
MSEQLAAWRPERSRRRRERCSVGLRRASQPVKGVDPIEILVTHPPKIMLEELRSRNYSDQTSRHYLHRVEEFAGHFGNSPDKPGLEDVHTYVAAERVTVPQLEQALATLHGYSDAEAVRKLSTMELNRRLKSTRACCQLSRGWRESLGIVTVPYMCSRCAELLRS